MRRLRWLERQDGDVFLVRSKSVLSEGICAAEKLIHPTYSDPFIPTHGGVVWSQNFVVEAGMGFGENSVCLVHKDSEYIDNPDIEVWRPEGISPRDAAIAVDKYTQAYCYQKYGLWNLFGEEWVALVKATTGRDVENPIQLSYYCTQGCLLYLGKYVQPSLEKWAEEAVRNETTLRNMDPLALRIAFLTHSTSPENRSSDTDVSLQSLGREGSDKPDRQP